MPLIPDLPLPKAPRRSLPVQAVTAGILTAFVGFGGSFAIVLQGLAAVGATTAQLASALLALCLGMGVVGMGLSRWTRMPISIAWSTPGAALLASSGAVTGDFPTAIGAFIVAGGLIVLAGAWAPLSRLVAAVPASLANAMLAGILLHLCLAPFAALAVAPLPVLAILVVFLVVGRFARLYAVPAAVMTAFAGLALTASMPAGVTGTSWSDWVPALVPIVPHFGWQATIGIALPLFIVTMASQNITGAAVLAVYGFRPKLAPLLRVTGLVSMLIAPFGAHTINLAAITAAIAAGPDADPRPERRYIAAMVAGATYILFGALAGIAATVVSASPPVLIEAAAGLALLGAFGASIVAGFKDEADRPAALMTFLITAADVRFAGIGSAFWGLVAGLAVLALHGRLARRTV
ncbi:MAG: benzoate/H(+) symporter BenE family transporter [Azospirillaceae bacterium]|nr:benzoate/H(+) symporter BenE family transporter [Azospirillaceae bacterium]